MMPPGLPRTQEHRQALLVCIVLIVAAALRFYNLGDQSLWGDEVRSIQRSQAILDNGLSSGLFDAHGPLFFYTLLPFVSGAVSEWAARFPSALFGVALTLVVYLIGKEFLDRNHALLAAAIAAASPFSIYYSQEVRYVGLFILFSALSMLMMLRTFETGTPRAWIGYFVTTLLTLFCFVGGVFLLLGQNVWIAFARPRRVLLIRWLVCQALIFAVFAPWLLRAFNFDLNPFRKSSPESVSVSSLKAGYQRALQPTHLAYALYTFGAGFSLGPSSRELHERPTLSTVRAHAATAVPAALVFGALAIAGVYRSFSLSRSRASLILLCLAAPLVCAYLVSSISRIPLNPRYTAAAFPPYLLLLAAGASWWWRQRCFGLLLPLAGAGLILLSLANGYHSPRYAKEDNRGAAALLTRYRQADEPLIVGIPVHAFAFYYSAPLTPWKRVVLEKPESASGAPGGIGAGRVWVAASRTWENPRFEELLQEMQVCFRLEQRHDLTGYEVLAFDTRPEGMKASCTLRIRS